MSKRTNLEAYQFLKQVFKMVETIPIPLDKIPHFPALHLKSMISHMDFFTHVAPEGPEADQLLELMNLNMLGYDVVRVPNPLACNLVSANGRILAQDGGCSQSRDILSHAAELRGHKIEFVDCSEIAKVDGALTCCSVLLMGN
jgi:dimethylargininase